MSVAKEAAYYQNVYFWFRPHFFLNVLCNTIFFTFLHKYIPCNEDYNGLFWGELVDTALRRLLHIIVVSRQKKPWPQNALLLLNDFKGYLQHNVP